MSLTQETTKRWLLSVRWTRGMWGLFSSQPEQAWRGSVPSRILLDSEHHDLG